MQYCFTIKELGSAEIDPHCPVLIYFCMDVYQNGDSACQVAAAICATVFV